MHPSPLPRAEHKRKTRVQITKAAVTLFEQRGYDNVTIDDIATHAGVSPRTVYRYCISKDRIIVEDDTDEVPYFMMMLAQQPPESSVAEAILGTVRVFSEFNLDDPELILRRLRLATKIPAIRQARAKKIEELETALVDWLAARAGVAANDLAVRAQGAALAAGYRLLYDALAEQGLDDYLGIAASIIHAVAPDPLTPNPSG